MRERKRERENTTGGRRRRSPFLSSKGLCGSPVGPRGPRGLYTLLIWATWVTMWLGPGWVHTQPAPLLATPTASREPHSAAGQEPPRAVVLALCQACTVSTPRQDRACAAASRLGASAPHWKTEDWLQWCFAKETRERTWHGLRLQLPAFQAQASSDSEGSSSSLRVFPGNPTAWNEDARCSSKRQTSQNKKQ